METLLQGLVSSLPELYQAIYGHPEWDAYVSRDTRERLEIINQHYESLEKALGRPLRVLDLGCAQGFFSLNLANRGALVNGIDFQKDNINVCRALAEENPHLNVSFSLGKIEHIIEQLKADEYDMVLGLSVFHHLIHENGIEQVKRWLQILSNCIPVLILELALKTEPLYWAESQPDAPSELLEKLAFYHQIGEFKTHLSDIKRPLYVASNSRLIFDDFNETFDFWTNKSHPDHCENKYRRYYFAKKFICKIYQLDKKDICLARSYTEIQNEISFLTNPIKGFNTPSLLLHGANDKEHWIVLEKIPGTLLQEKIKSKEKIDIESILHKLLTQLVLLEEAGLYHDDLRVWNILVSENHEISLIDYGSISKEKRDCMWPKNIFQSFFIFVNELILKRPVPDCIRSAPLNPFALPEPYSNWMYAFWKKPASQWSFTLLKKLFVEKAKLNSPSSTLSSIELWILAQESMLMMMQAKASALEKNSLYSYQQIEARTQQMEARTQQMEARTQQMEARTQQMEARTQQMEARTQQMEARTQQMEARMQQMEAKTQQMEAKTLQADIQQAKMLYLLQLIHSSVSWRITAPLRWIRTKISQVYPKRILKKIKIILQHTDLYVSRRPPLKKVVLLILNRFPAIKSFFYHRLDPSSYRPRSNEVHIAGLTPTAFLPPEVHDIYLKLMKK